MPHPKVEKFLAMTNTLAYLSGLLVTKKKSFLDIDISVIQLFLITEARTNKLECSYLAKFLPFSIFARACPSEMCSTTRLDSKPHP
jgi:hypothetical protein